MTIYAQGVDYAFSHPTIASLQAAGKTFAVRYLYPASQVGGTKNLTLAEATALKAAGIDIVSNYESWAGRAADGYAAGQDDAKAADAQHKACGGPAGKPIYFSVDYQADPPTLVPYFQGVASVIGVARTGVYGDYAVVKYLLDNGLVAWAWQTYAWSAGQYDERCQLAQDQNGVAMGGADVDLDSAHAPDYGQWSGKPVPVPLIGSDMFELVSVTADPDKVGVFAWSTGGMWQHVGTPDQLAVLKNSKLFAGQREVSSGEFALLKAYALGAGNQAATAAATAAASAASVVSGKADTIVKAVAAIPTVPVDQAALERAVVDAVGQALAGGVPVGTVEAEVLSALGKAPPLPVTLTGTAGIVPTVAP